MTRNEKWFEQVIDHLKATESDTNEARRRVMDHVRESAGPETGRTTAGVLAWFLRPWTIRVRPVTVFALALVAAVAVIAALRDEGPAGDALPSAVTAVVDPAGEAAAGRRLVRFSCVASGATHVSVVGDFNDWAPGVTPLEQTAVDGLWSVVVPLEAGRHQYAFVVDNAVWLPDEHAPRAPDNDFGIANSVLIVPGDV